MNSCLNVKMVHIVLRDHLSQFNAHLVALVQVMLIMETLNLLASPVAEVCILTRLLATEFVLIVHQAMFALGTLLLLHPLTKIKRMAIFALLVITVQRAHMRSDLAQ